MAGCRGGDDGAGAPGGGSTSAAEQGGLHVAVAASGLRHDVTAIHFKVVGAGDACDAPALAEATSALEADDLPGGVLPPGSGSHAGAGGLFVLPSGDYRVCVTPLALGGPSLVCASTEGLVSVAPSITTEALLAPSCGASDGGGLDVAVALNDPPRITALGVAPSKFITQCQAATITAGAQDPDGDQTSFTWLVTSAPPGATAGLTVNGPVAQFSTDTPGEYQLQVVATDPYSASSFLTFPLHVSQAECNAAPSCQGDDGTLFCGGQSPDGCFCDALCVQFNDCCPDKVDVCGGGGEAGAGGAGGGEAGSGGGEAGAGGTGGGEGGAGGAGGEAGGGGEVAPVINEVVFNPPGIDVGCFAELKGTPGASLAGFALRAINGNGGTLINEILFTAEHAFDENGYFVVAQDANVVLPPGAAFTINPIVDLQNGPDNLVLVDPLGVTVDALGYSDALGTFNPPNVFFGEGTFALQSFGTNAAPSMSRLPDGADSNDNSIDFGVGQPTPGAANVGGG